MDPKTGLYSKAAKIIRSLPQERGTVDQMIGAARKLGLRDTELQNAGEMPTGKIDREELAKLFEARLPKLRVDQLGENPSYLQPHERQRHRELGNRLGRQEQLSPEEQQEYRMLQQRTSAGPNVMTRSDDDDNEEPVDTEYGGYASDGTQNYRERLLKLDQKQHPAVRAEEIMRSLRGRIDNETPIYGADHPIIQGYQKRLGELQQERDTAIRQLGAPRAAGQQYQSSHWSGHPDVVAHIRLSDRLVGPASSWDEAKKWVVPTMQKIADHMGASPAELGSGAAKYAVQNGLITPEEAATLTQLKGWQNEFTGKKGIDKRLLHVEELQSDWAQEKRDGKDVPDGPYVGNTQHWTDLALKNVLREAALGGYDGIVFPSGQNQADRYGLEKQLDRLQYSPNQKRLIGYKNGDQKVIKEGVERDHLPSLIGKDLTERLLAPENTFNPTADNQFHDLRGDDLKMGGQGMKGYYDGIVPKSVMKLAQMHDPSIKPAENVSYGEDGQQYQGFHLPMTDALRQGILKEGYPAMKRGGRIGYADGGSILDHPMYRALLEVAHGSANQQMVKRAIEAGKQQGEYIRTGKGVMQRDPRLIESPPVLSDIKPTSKSASLITPFEELQAGYASKGNLMPEKTADIEGMQREKAKLVPLVGDKTPAGTILMSHHGTPLTDPVNQQGGAGYMRSEFAQSNDPTGWRSRQGAAKGMQGRVQALGDETPIYGAHVSMGHKASDSSHMMLHAVIRHIPNLKIAKKHIKAFDEEMQKKFPHDEKFPMPWPGIMNTERVHDFFYRQPSLVKGKRGQVGVRLQARPGSDVTKFIQNMDSVRWQSAGFPSVASARFANTEPELLAEPQLATGFGITQLDPTRGLTPNDEFMAHETYTHGMPTKGYAGRFRALVPASEIWKEHLGAATTPPSIQHTLMTKFPAVTVDQRIVDLVKGAEEERKKRYGFMDGGAVMPNPTEAQKKAGNYQKRHISFQGLPISLESIKGQTRSGTDPNGKKWSVRLPYDYGYIKRTEGADGDHVDVCIGPDHESDHVFIIDQNDLGTGKFDEHKVMLGYRTKEEATKAYRDGFSDGRGIERMGAVARMSMPEFKRWLKHCDTKKPVRGQGHMDRAMELASRYNAKRDRDAG